MEDVVVIGAGIVGLATARALLRARPGLSVTVLDKADDVATAQTGHNSGVIHAGIYYAPGSLKARLCRAGEAATKAFCDEHGISYAVPGKLVVATEEPEVVRLRALGERAAQNGIELESVDGARLRALEPNVRGLEALLSPATGIVDFREVARAMAAELVASGVRVVTRAAVRSIAEDGTGVHLESDTGELRARALVACAGLQADRVARMGGLDVRFRIVPFRGEYYQLPAAKNDLVTRLIYPVPDPELPFLGVHLSPTIDGRVTVGPNAVLGLSREGYPRGAVRLRDVASYSLFPGMWRFGRGNLRTGLSEARDSVFRSGYLRQVQKYAPSLTVEDLLPYPAGIRAQAITRTGRPVEDFLLRHTARQVHVCNAPSPAATSAIPIGERVGRSVLGVLDR
ncbi:L-2-hydroxyglutarate oxidase [Ornithinimicrobium sp. F0845]|uniref:L-2-hydroxyglutarate oxidase n=1 Tax=Ornithinimicrobium sp. F0845 TaxID=2926412 RepID=UPI001FF548E7|nr:L-2-hydroxyglutarate oxidase [Ornithinimicrobium sp. F0845]MCK0110562.1 L-2-hydroxyglutarate oxidase [Ornithinimicrobium sp. F0845]